MAGASSVERALLKKIRYLITGQTLDAARGQGHGAALLVATEDYARRRGAVLIWCNARVTAAEFYRHHGWQILGEVFDIPSVGPHYKMLRYFATA